MRKSKSDVRVFAIVDSYQNPAWLISRLGGIPSLVWYTTHKVVTKIATTSKDPTTNGFFGSKMGGACLNTVLDLIWDVDVSSSLLTYDQMFNKVKNCIPSSVFGTGETA